MDAHIFSCLFNSILSLKRNMEKEKETLIYTIALRYLKDKLYELRECKFEFSTTGQNDREA